MGSFLFHASLKCTLQRDISQHNIPGLMPFCVNFLDPMQLIDELSMIYTTCLMCYGTFSYSKSRQYAFSLAIALVSLAVFITLYYHYLQDPAFHQNAYAILTTVVLARSMKNNTGYCTKGRWRQGKREYRSLRTGETQRFLRPCGSWSHVDLERSLLASESGIWTTRIVRRSVVGEERLVCRGVWYWKAMGGGKTSLFGKTWVAQVAYMLAGILW